MKPLKIGITGVRGVVGEAFTPELAVGFAQAFGTYLDGGRIVVSRDTRPSGPMVHAIDLGANYWSLWTESDNLRRYYERYPNGFETLQRRLGYRLRPSCDGCPSTHCRRS